jgi:hypothetical protein
MDVIRGWKDAAQVVATKEELDFIVEAVAARIGWLSKLGEPVTEPMMKAFRGMSDAAYKTTRCRRSFDQDRPDILKRAGR